jgi:hypothetical protein
MLEVIIGRPARKVIHTKVVIPRQKQEKMAEQIKLETGNKKLETGNQKPDLKKRKSEQSVAMDHLTRSSFKGSVYNLIMKRFKNTKILL